MVMTITRPTRRWRETVARDARDAVPLLSIMLGLLFVLPPRLVVGGLGASGRPAIVFAAGLFGWWVLTRIDPSLATHGPQPVRWAVGAFLAAMLVAYALGYGRGLDDPEANASDRTMLTYLALAGIALVVADGVRSRAALDRLLGRLVALSAFMSVVGILQFIPPHFDLTRHIQAPGLSLSAPLIGIGSRGQGQFARVAGTAGHYIEFGVVLGMVVPLAIHYAMYSPRERRSRRWAAVGLIACSVPFSVSRSGIIALLVGLAVLATGWTTRQRLNGLVVSVVTCAAFMVLKPGLLGTLRTLFTGYRSDPSYLSRAEDYAETLAYVRDRPLFGRGPGTFLPEKYRLLDNQWLLSLVTTGWVGAAALALLMLAAVLIALRTRRITIDAQTRDLAHALAAGVIAAAVTTYTFDSLYFTTFAAVLFVMVGATGALLRLARERDAQYDPRELL